MKSIVSAFSGARGQGQSLAFACAGAVFSTACLAQSGESYDCTTGISADELIDDLAAYGLAEGDPPIGETEDLIVSADGQIRSLVVEIGGALGIGEVTVYVPWDEVEVGETWVRIPVDGPDTRLSDVFSGDDLIDEIDPRAAGVEVGWSEVPSRAFRADEVIGDFARQRDEGNLLNFGIVGDLLIQDGRIAAVVIEPGFGLGFAEDVVVGFDNYAEGAWNPGGISVEFDRTETLDIGAFRC